MPDNLFFQAGVLTAAGRLFIALNLAATVGDDVALTQALDLAEEAGIDPRPRHIRCAFLLAQRQQPNRDAALQVLQNILAQSAALEAIQ